MTIMKVLALIFDGFEELEATAPFALLRRAGIDLTIASFSSNVTGSHNLTYTNINILSELDYTQFDALLLPGGAHYKIIQYSEDVLTIIKYFLDNDKVVSAICASPTIIGKLGYLKDKNYTCFKSMNEDFGGTFIDCYVVVDGNLITAKSAAASIDFAYAIIEKLAGKETLDKVKSNIFYEEQGTYIFNQ